MTILTNLHARQVFDSRGNPTIEVEASSKMNTVRAMVPSGASTGVHEAHELRDNATIFLGKGVLKAVENVNTILASSLQGTDMNDQQTVDTFLIEKDGTQNKKRLGANALLGVSMACAKLSAKEKGMSLFTRFQEIAKKQGYETSGDLLPTPMMNVINGGAHADSGLDIQEFMIMPTGAKSFSEALRIGIEIFHTLKKNLKQKGYVIAVGDEGGFAPHFSSNEEAIDSILQAAKDAEHLGKIQIAFDIAASEFYKDGVYHFENKKRTSKEMIDFYEGLCNKYPVVSLEDGLDEDDWDGWTELTQRLGEKVQLVGDDLLVTNTSRIQQAIEKKAGNAVLIKMNQIGTITETIEAVKLASSAGWNSIISHRSGETEDTTIADLAVGLETGQIKTGSLCRTDRIAKYNQLLRIEELLGERGRFK